MGFQHSLITGLVYPGKNDGLLIQRYHPPYWSKTWQIPGKDGKPVVIRAVWDGTVMNVSVDVASGELAAGPPRAIFKAYLYEINDLENVSTSQELKFSFALEYVNGSWRMNDQYEGGSVTRQDRYFVGQGTPFSYKIFDTVHSGTRLASFEQTSVVRRDGETLIGTAMGPNYGVALPTPGTARYVIRTGNGTWATWDATYENGVATGEIVGTMTEPLKNPAGFFTVLRGFYMNQSGSEAMHICPAHVDTNLPALLRVSLPGMTHTVQQASTDSLTSTGGEVSITGVDNGPSGAGVFVFGGSSMSLHFDLGTIPEADRVSITGQWSETKGEFFIQRHEEFTVEYYIHGAFSYAKKALVRAVYSMDGHRYSNGSVVIVDSTSTLTVTVLGATYTRTDTTTGEIGTSTNEELVDEYYEDLTHETTLTQPLVAAAIVSGGGEETVTEADWVIASAVSGTGPGGSYTTTFSTPAWCSMSAPPVTGAVYGGVVDHISFGDVVSGGSHSLSGSFNSWEDSVPYIPRGGLAHRSSLPTTHTFAWLVSVGSDGVGGGSPGWPYTADWTYSYAKAAATTSDLLRFPLAGDFDPANNARIATVHDDLITASGPVTISKTKQAYEVAGGSTRIDEEGSSVTGAVTVTDRTELLHDGVMVGRCDVVTTTGQSSGLLDRTKEVKRSDGAWTDTILSDSSSESGGGVSTTGAKMEILFADPRLRFYIYTKQTPSFVGDSNYLASELHVTLQGQTFGPFDLGTNYLEGPRAFLTDRLTLETAATALVDGVWWALVIVNLYNGKSFGRLLSSGGEQVDLADLLTGTPEHYWIRNIEHVQ